MAGQPAVDAEARERAAAVEAQLNAHEKYCGERWEMTTEALSKLDTKLSNSIAKVHEKIDRCIRWAIGILISIAAFAIVQWFLYAKVARAATWLAEL